MEKEQVDECTKKIPAEMKEWQRGWEYYEEGSWRRQGNNKLLKDQERENEVEQETWKMEEKNVCRTRTQWK